MAVVMKFGGTSVGTPEAIKTLCALVQKQDDPVVVVSALSGTTDALIKAFSSDDYEKEYLFICERQRDMLKALGLDETLVDSLLEELKSVLDNKDRTEQQKDLISSFGERMSARIVAAYLASQNLPAEAIDAFNLGLITDSHFTHAHPLDQSKQTVHDSLTEATGIPIITGFIAKDKEGNITTLGRGGSDFTAAYIGSSINADEIQIWTDVDGILSADPKVVPQAGVINEISFAEAAELSFFGAKVVHPKTLLPAIDAGIPVIVKNTHNPEAKGTHICNRKHVSSTVVKAITAKPGNTIINVCSSRMLFAHGFLAKIFELFDKHPTSVDIVTTSEVSVSMSVSSTKHLETLKEELSAIGTVNIINEKAIICLVGEGIQSSPGIFGKVFTLLSDNNIAVDAISQGASKRNLTFVVDDTEANKVVQLLHKHLMEQ